RRDFALWKAAKATQPDSASWDTPLGRGRPGSHLGCSAMSRKYLREPFDLHAGGLDLRCPHHETEQPHSRAAGAGRAPRRARPGRATVDYSATAMAEAETVWERFRATAVRAARLLGEHPSTALDAPLGEVELPADFTAAMDDDLTVPEALAVIHREQSALNTLLAGRDAADPAEIADSLGRLRAMLDVLGLDPLGAQWARPDGTGGGEREALDALITAQ